MEKQTLKKLALAVSSTLVLGMVATAHAADAKDSPRASESSGSVGQFVDDATITTRVKTRFAKDPTVSASRIKVDTVKGVVELSGHVSSNAEKAQAVAIAEAVPDVRSVRNNLTVKGDGGAQPAAARTAPTPAP
ncbi:MAG TPA: BON domain-containing protein [Rhodocyclaceae bacterium]|jgi:osmotically-inducible protein OsmY|nr:BON domain-containing protein [Rhodocyclaceae bacterium]